MPVRGSRWQPRTVLRFVQSYGTSTRPVRVATDRGEGFLKALGNPAGPHALACEWVGSQLARWFGLPTFDFALIEIGKDDEIPFHGGGVASPGPAFITRAEAGFAWGGDPDSLKTIANPTGLGRLVVFDTWTLNCDRCPPDPATRKPNYDNVFLSRDGAPPDRFLLKAIDHTHCFTCGRDLNRHLADLANVEDARVYGLFPAFRDLIRRPDLAQAARDLGTIRKTDVEAMVASVPPEWQVVDSARRAWVELIVRRAAYVSRTAAISIIGHGELDV